MAGVRDRGQERYPYLAYAIAATAVVLGSPAAYLLLLHPLIGDASGASAAVGALLAALLAAVGGSQLWRRTRHARRIQFGDLMLWTWIRRRRADETVERNVRRLGFDRAGRRLRRIHISSADQLAMLRQLSESLEVKDPYTRHHSARVERLSFRTAVALGLDNDEIQALRRAASVHDVGKIQVSLDVLRKPGSLTPQERKEIEKHAVIGARMVRGLGDDKIVGAVRHHHERWDGGGYPDGLSGVEIPLFARIIAVVDTYDAITSTRAYRPRASSAHAREIIRAEAGAQFDPDVVEAFLGTFAERGSLVGAFAGLLSHRPFLRMADWAERSGAGALAPAVASALVVGLIAPAVLVPAAPPAQAGTGPAAGARPAEARDFATGRSADAGWGDTLRAEGDLVRALRKSARNDQARVLGKVVKKRRRGPGRARKDRAAQSAHGPASHGGAVRASASSGGAAELQVPTDPQPDKGNDCDHPGKRGTRGYALHCGS